MKNTIRHVVCPLLAAMIWGTAFSAQSICADYVTPFALNAARAAIACVLLFLICVVRRVKVTDWRRLIFGGLLGRISFLSSGRFRRSSFQRFSGRGALCGGRAAGQKQQRQQQAKKRFSVFHREVPFL